jgi:hypothetical protein
MKVENEKFLDSIHKHNYKFLSLHCRHEVTNLKIILNYIRQLSNTTTSQILSEGFNYNNEYKNEDVNIFLLQTWIYSILNNPFDFSNIIPKDYKEELIRFVFENIVLEKLSVKIFVKIAKLDEILGCEKFDKYIMLKEYSKISRIDKHLIVQIVRNLLDKIDVNLCNKSINKEENLDLHKTKILVEGINDFNIKDDENTINSLIYKFKILSYQYKYYPDIITSSLYFKYLNYNNYKFGYSLCRSFLRIIKHYDAFEVSKILQKYLVDIFANEMLWINSLHILGSLIFKKYPIEIDNRIIELGLFYNQDDINYRSVLVREYSLFLVYSMFRNNPSEYLINILIFKCIFDNNYKIRNIAASILSTHFNVEYKTKRLTDRIESYDKIGTLFNIQVDKYLKNTSNNIDVIDLQNNIIKKYNLQIKINYRDKFIFYYINLGYNIKYSIEYNRDILDLKEFLTLNISSLYKFRFSDKLIDVYIDILELIPRNNLLSFKDGVIKNIIFLLSKNIKNDKICEIIWTLDDSFIYEFMFKNRNRTNKNIIIGNIKNYKYIDTIIKEYKNKIRMNENIDYIVNIYKSLKCMTDIKNFEKEILMGLENYLLTSRGDVCYEIRLECIILIKYDLDIFNKYLIRYLVDKNKFIRDHLFNNIDKYEELIFNYEILAKKDITIILNNLHMFDTYNITIGILGYLNTSDNYKYEEILEAFINNIGTFDKYIRMIIDRKYERVYSYIFKIIVILYQKSVTEYIFDWAELLRDYDVAKYNFIKEMESSEL